MNLEIKPYIGVGPIRFGMTRDEVLRIVGHPVITVKPFLKGPHAGIPTDAFDELGIHVFYKIGYLCEAIEMYLAADPTFNGQRLIERPFDELFTWLRTLDDNVKVDDTGLTSFKLGFGLYAPSCEESPSDAVEAVIAFESGYYDTHG
jgi:hypothetical protein